MQAIVAAALARFTASASPPPTTEALEQEDQRRRSEEAQVAMGRDEEPEFMGTQEAPREVGPRGLGVADKAGPKTGEVETCRHEPRGGACGQMLAGSPTPSRRCRGEYPRNCS